MAQVATNPFTALDQALAAAVSAAAPSVVHVSRGHHAGGTGIVWAPDLVISASFHTPDRTTIGVPSADDPDGELDRREAEVIGRDPGTDVALLRVSGGGLTPATFRDAGGLAVGNLALAIGRPGRSARASLRAIGVLGPAMKTPHGGALDRYVESDRPIPRGFAGGPLVDADGAVRGMNTRTLLRGADVAVPTETLTRIVPELEQHGGVRRGYLGVAAYPAMGPSPAGKPGVLAGALVANVEDGSPAHAAGLLVGDLIVDVAGTPVEDPRDLRGALGHRPGETVAVKIVRGGAAQTLDVVLGAKAEP